MRRIFLMLILLFTSVSISNDYTFVDKEINIFKKIETKEKETKVKETKKVSTPITTYNGYITAYGPDCKGCIGITASGYNVSKGNIYYKDKEYGKVRILAADKKLPFGTIVRIKKLNISKEPILGIVLDRGGAIGFNKRVYFDLLYPNEKSTISFGKQKAVFEILRTGY